ncbi:uncharacterized protein LOC142322378 [Lycorma delicatula]|uniref:uncharacterized protein LOC142322378 n=1 Tax=Lycorma delicatula TaxID=130591 RepID=UPI003F5102C4
MNEVSDKEKLTINDFKNQVRCLLKATSQLNSSERAEAFGYLQKCVSSFESDEPEVNNKQLENVKGICEDNRESRDSDCDSISEITLDTNQCIRRDIEKEKTSDVDCNKFKCLECEKKFINLEQLYLHGLEQHPGTSVSCQNCNETFNNIETYNKHLNLKNCSKPESKRPEILKCSFCDKLYHNFQHYTLHMEGHKRNKCLECGVHFNSRKNLEEHTLNTHNKELEKGLFMCKFCDRKFVQKRSLLKHYKVIHSKDHIICLTCGLTFETEEELRNHDQTHTYNSFTCQTCNEKFTRRQQYIVHIKEHDKYQCITCKTSYANKSKLEKHEQAGHSIQGVMMQHQCSVCCSSFHFQSSLFFHKKTHSNSTEQFGCEPCKRIFKNYSAYREHLLTEQHSSSINGTVSTNLLQCKHCNKIFTNKRRLLKHENKYHKGKRLFQCEICDFKSHSESCINKHQKLHTKKKEFICEKCGDSFYRKNALLDHFNFVHSEERNFSCEKCGQTFKAASVLNRHMLCHSKEPTYVCHCGQAYKFSGNLNRHQLLVHGKTTKSKRVKRLITDDVANLTSNNNKNKNKQEMKSKKQQNDVTTIYTLIDSQAAVSLPLDQVVAHSNILLSNNNPDSQLLQVSYHSLNLPSENKLVYSQSLDITSLREVDTIIQSEESQINTASETPQTTQHLFGQQLGGTDTDNFLQSESLMHLPIEPSMVTSLEEEPLHSTDGIGTAAEHFSTSHNLMTEYSVPYNIHFLNM